MDDGLRSSSRALKNPGKPYFLQLAVDAVRDVNVQHDKHGMSHAKKAII
jgi:hypothetical protein